MTHTNYRIHGAIGECEVVIGLHPLRFNGLT
jgi:hypothetical protein